MAFDIGSAAVGAAAGFLLKGTDIKAPSGLLNFGKLGTAFVDGLGNLYQTIKDNAGKIHIGNPLGGVNQVAKLAYDTTSKGLKAVVRGAGNVWHALTDDQGNPVTPTSGAGGKRNQDGTFSWSSGISNEDIQDFAKAIKPIATEYMYQGDQIQGEEIKTDNAPMVIDSTTGKRTVDREKLILYAGGGIIAVLLLALVMQRSRR